MKITQFFLLAAFFMIGLPNSDAQTHSVSYDDYDEYGGYDYEVSSRYVDLFSRSDRRYYYKLLDRLDRVEQDAWANGRLSRSERRRIDDILEELDDLVYRYKRSYNSRYTDRRPYRPTYRAGSPALYIAASLLGRNRNYYRGNRRSYRSGYRSGYRSNSYNRRSRSRTRCY